jgi:plastocyanin
MPLGAFLLALVCLLVPGPRPGSVEVRGTAVTAGKPVQGAVVWIDVPDAAIRRPQEDTVVLDQRNLSFSPRVLAVQVGTRIEFPNHDRVFHNVFSFRDGKRFDLGLYPVGAVKTIPFDQPGLSRVFCNIHPGMAAYIMVVDTPVFAVSDRSGQFSLSDVPQGTLVYHAWRPGGAILNGSISVSPGAVLDIQWP